MQNHKKVIYKESLQNQIANPTNYKADPYDADRNPAISEEDLQELRHEELLARSHHISWQDRGPPGPNQGGPETWRGQRFREGTGKWANRGGQWREYYRGYYSAMAAKGKDRQHT